MRLYGHTLDKLGEPIANAQILVKDRHFQTLYETESDAHGTYSLELPAGNYPFIMAVRDYAERYLEYWCQNLHLTQDTQLDLSFDSLELYGLHVFQVLGGYPSLMLYVRPMSLEKFKQGGVADCCPDIQSIRVLVDRQEVSLLVQSKVEEFIGDGAMTALLIQVSLPEQQASWHRLDVEIRDNSGAFGAATIFS
ncbi:MAG: carboxypeptidase regulatory-like domain-containing protein [Oscillospiraceae bacterium]|nr:carboxypeptidase regulatory-like domain-containing protein [Oscillospiraceae bacterium]